MNGMNLPVVHPSFQSLRKNGKLLHLVAAALITIHAITHLNHPGANKVYFACLVLIALDIFILVVATRNALALMPRINLFFRGIECLFFLGIGIELVFHEHWLNGLSHILIGFSYLFLFYCERKLGKGEQLGFYHTGISLPSLPENKFLLWSNVSNIKASYSSIQIVTPAESMEFELQNNLQFAELDQIHEFCRHYLGQAE